MNDDDGNNDGAISGRPDENDSPIPSGRRIYLASSWRNPYHQTVVKSLRADGHEVYDFRNPTEGYDNPVEAFPHGFQWAELDPLWQHWSNRAYVQALQGPVAERGYQSDWRAMQWANTGVLLLPCGRSAHLEAGYFVGAGKPLHILLTDPMEPELMYKMATEVHYSGLGLYTALKRSVEA